MLLLIRGASESARINAAMVVLKIGILVFFCVVTFTQFDVQNLTPFAPFGVAGIAAAASQVFFSYLGFDAVSTAGAEAKNRQRDLPFAILGSLVAVTALYLAVSFASVAAVPFETFSEMDVEAILSSIVNNALGMSKAGLIIDLGAVIAIFSVVLVATAYYVTAAEFDDSKIVGQFQATASGEEFGLLFQKGNPLVTCVNNALTTLKDSGELQEIQDAWLAGATAPYFTE